MRNLRRKPLVKEHQVQLRCEDLGLRSTNYHKGWISLEVDVNELVDYLTSQRVRVIKTNEPGFGLRNEHEVQVLRRSGRWEYMVSIGENPLRLETDYSAWVADCQFDRLKIFIKPHETNS